MMFRFARWSFILMIGCEASPRFTLLQESNATVSASEVDRNSLRTHVESLVAERLDETPVMVSWYPNHPFTQARSADYVQRVLADDLQLDPVVERSSEDGISAQNVYVDITGAVAPEEMVILAAHHDAWFSGADDNGSGVAVLLEAARVFKDARPDRTIRIVAFDLEEFGVIGSNRFVRSHGTEGVVAVVNLDAIAYADHRPGSQDAPPGLALRDTGDFIAVLANAPAESHLARVARLSGELPAPVDMLGLLTPGDAQYPGLRDFLRSDHAPYWRHRVPALFFTDTASFRNPHYHTAGDTPDTLDYDFFARVAQLVVGTVRALATVS
jgi:Zn-dependent M28 family amino/carboxypeptidase